MIYELKLPKQCIKDCSHSGDVEADVIFWLKDKRISSQLAKIPSEQIALCLKGYGCWDEEELQDTMQNLRRLLFVAAGYCVNTKENTYCVE